MLFSFHSMSSYLHSRPPFSLFVLSLVSLSLTSFALALYCHTSTSLPNTDVLDWHKLLSQLSRLKICIESGPSNRTVLHPGSGNMTAALEGVELEGRLGLVAGSGGKVRLSGILSPALLGLSGPPLLLQLRQEGGTSPVCVGVTGTGQQLTHLTNSTVGRSGCLGEGGEDVEGEMQFSAHRPAHLPAAWCSHGSPTTWRFQSDKDQWGTLLTEADRARVVSHLMITSALLLAVACGLLLWAASRSGRPSRSHMTLLPTEEEEDF